MLCRASPNTDGCVDVGGGAGGVPGGVATSAPPPPPLPDITSILNNVDSLNDEIDYVKSNYNRELSKMRLVN